MRAELRGDALLRRLARVKRPERVEAAALGPEMVGFFKRSVEKRQVKLGRIAECWGRGVPAVLAEHCALESFSRGTLVVLVDSSAHLYDLKQLLLGGLEEQLLMACKGAGLRKITLKKGRWYGEEREVEF